MESTHVISITNVEENIAQREGTKTFRFPLPPIISRLRENKIHCSLVPFTCCLRRDKQKKSDQETRNMIHSIKVGISLVLASLLYLLDPLYQKAGENAMWAIMTVVVLFEFSPGATLGKGLNRGIGTTVGGGLGCIAAVLGQNLGGVGNSIITGTSVFIFGAIATYFRMVPSIKKKYDYGVMIFILTFNLVLVSGVRAEQEVWEIARDRLLTIIIGFIICICVSLFVFPMWASDELHDSTVSRYEELANTIQGRISIIITQDIYVGFPMPKFRAQNLVDMARMEFIKGCLEEYVKLASEKENQPCANFTVCKSLLSSKSKDESMANFAKWEPWHGKFGFSYPWTNYLKIGGVHRDLAAIILAMGGCLQVSRQPMALSSSSQTIQFEPCEAIGSKVVWTLRELGDSLKQMRKCEPHISAKLKAARAELSMVISTSKIPSIENSDALAVVSFMFLLKEVVDKVEELTKEVEQLGEIAGFRTHSTLVS